jgi:peptidyl-prolyl cis-trans isomerase C
MQRCKIISARAGTFATIGAFAAHDAHAPMAPVTPRRRRGMIRTAYCCCALATLGLVVLCQSAVAQSGSSSPPKKESASSPPEERAWPTGNAATVNGQPLSEAAVQRVLLRVPKDKQKQFRAEVIDSIVENMLLDQYLQQVKPNVDQKEVDKRCDAVREEIKKSGEDVDKVLRSVFLTEKEIKEQISADLRWDAFLNEKATDAVLKEMIAKEPEIVDGSMVRARHILLTPNMTDAKACEQAQADLKQIKKDIEKKVTEGLAKLPKDADNLNPDRELNRDRERCKLLDDAFATAAKEKSACPSKEAGGDVNFFARNGVMVEAFAKAAFALKPYQLSDVVKTTFGYHLILVTDRKAGTPVKFETVQEELKEIYGMRLRGEIVSQVRTQSKIVITPQQ